MSTSDKPLKMVTCGGCESKVFIPGDLPPLASVPCSKCGHGIMMPMQLRQFELRSKIASGGHGKVYRAFDTVLERLVADVRLHAVLRVFWVGHTMPAKKVFHSTE